MITVRTSSQNASVPPVTLAPPNGWREVRLLDVCEFVRGREPGRDRYNRKGIGVPYIRVGNIAAGKQEWIHTDSSDVVECEEHDILMSFDGSPGVVRRGFRGAISSGIRKVVPRGLELDRDFLYYALQAPAIQRVIDAHASGVTIKHASKAIPHLRALVPPLPEQKAIASFLAKVERAIAAADQVIGSTRRLSLSLRYQLFGHGPARLTHVAEGERTVSERGLLPKSWRPARLGELARISSGGTPDRGRPEYWRGDIPWIKTGEINYRLIDSAEEHITDLGLANSSARIVPKGAVLMAMYGQGVTRGRVAVLGIDAALNQACAAIEPGPELDRQYLYHWLAYRYEFIRALGHGANQKNLNAAMIKQLLVPVPPIEEQREIAQILDATERKLAAESQERAKLQKLLASAAKSLLQGSLRVNEVAG